MRIAFSVFRPGGYTIGQIPISVTRFAQLNALSFDPLKDSSSWVGAVRQRKARLLATWGAQRMKAFADVPTSRSL